MDKDTKTMLTVLGVVGVGAVLYARRRAKLEEAAVNAVIDQVEQAAELTPQSLTDVVTSGTSTIGGTRMGQTGFQGRSLMDYVSRPSSMRGQAPFCGTATNIANGKFFYRGQPV